MRMCVCVCVCVYMRAGACGHVCVHLRAGSRTRICGAWTAVHTRKYTNYNSSTLPPPSGKLWVHDPPCPTHAPGCRCRFRDIRSFQRFDGNHPHYTERFSGERYSVVFYTHRSFAKCRDRVGVRVCVSSLCGGVLSVCACKVG